MVWCGAACQLLSSRRARAGWGHQVSCRKLAGLLGPAQGLCPWADFMQGFPAWHARDGRRSAPVAAGMVKVHELLGMYPLLCHSQALGSARKLVQAPA